MVSLTRLSGVFHPQVMIQRTRSSFFSAAVHIMLLHTKNNILSTCFHRDGQRPFDRKIRMLPWHVCEWDPNTPKGLIPSLKLTFSHLKMDGWNLEYQFPFGMAYLRCELLVSGRVDLHIGRSK